MSGPRRVVHPAAANGVVRIARAAPPARAAMAPATHASGSKVKRARSFAGCAAVGAIVAIASVVTAETLPANVSIVATAAALRPTNAPKAADSPKMRVR